MFLVIGTTTVDLFISGFERLPRTEGDEFTIDSLAFCKAPLRPALGGNGAISAFTLARLGAPVVLSTAIGQDWLGVEVTGWLEEAGVEMNCVARRAGAATAATVVVSDDARNRLSFHHAGANETLAEADVPAALLAQADVLLLTSYPLLNGLRPEGSAALLAAAHRSGTITALDIGPAIGEPALLSEISGLLPDVDYLFCNEHELSVCTEDRDLRAGMACMLAERAQCVVVKRGAQGATVWRNGASPVDVPGFAVDAHSTVGAGDSFNAGFLHALTQGQDSLQAARFANAVAALLVSAHRGALGAPTLQGVRDFLVRAAASGSTTDSIM